MLATYVGSIFTGQHSNFSRKICGNRPRMASNYRSPVVLCSPVLTLKKNFTGWLLTLPTGPCISESCVKIKIN